MMHSEFMSIPAESELVPQNSNGDTLFPFRDKGWELRTKAEAEKYS